MSVIMFASTKGGVAKTTSAIITAQVLAQKHKVTLIDADPSKRLISWSQKGEVPDNLMVIESGGERFIQDEIAHAASKARYVIVDTEGAASRLNAYVMGESDLVIIPMGDEQPDAEGAIETLAQLKMEARLTRRTIPVRILFARTQAAVKSRLERTLNEQVREKVGSFHVELNRRTAFSSLHNLGGTLYDMDPKEVTGVDRAIFNAERFVEELQEFLGHVQSLDEDYAAVSGPVQEKRLFGKAKNDG